MRPPTLVVLGCRAGSPDATSPASGYVVDSGTTRVLVDCGPGVVAAAASHGLLHHLDAVLVTHEHADHCADLVALAFHRAFPTLRDPLPLFAPTGFRQVLDGLDRVFGIPSLPELRSPLGSGFRLTEVEPGRGCRIGDLRVDTLRAAHPVPTLSVRFDDLGLVYTADTGLTDDLTRFSRAAPLLLAEATYVRGDGRDLVAHGHLTGRLAGKLAREARVQRLVLTHFADLDDAEGTAERTRLQYSGALQCAAPGMRIPLAPAA